MFLCLAEVKETLLVARTGWMEIEVERGGNKSNMILAVISYGEHVLRPEERHVVF